MLWLLVVALPALTETLRRRGPSVKIAWLARWLTLTALGAQPLRRGLPRCRHQSVPPRAAPVCHHDVLTLAGHSEADLLQGADRLKVWDPRELRQLYTAISIS